MDDWGARIKTENLKKGTVCTYQVHREGMAQPLAYTPLNEPWGDDGIFYFAALSFRRAGHYVVTFLVEGPGLNHIKPLVYHINVEAKSILQGPLNAWNRLNARNFTHANERLINWGRRELNAALYDLTNELTSVRSLLLTIYAALPNGSLVMGPDSEDTLGVVNELSSVAEPEGWNKCLDRYWRGAVMQASTPQELMECVLLLEHYIARQWLYGSTSHSKAPLLAALPAAHHAMRHCTLSAVALRLYCLDRVFLYDKIQVFRRGSRVVGGDIKPTPNSLTHKGTGTKSRPAPAVAAPSAPPPGRYSKNSGGRGAPEPELDSGRVHRAAYDKARQRLSRGGDLRGSDSSNDDSDGGRNAKKMSKPKAEEWDCSYCSFTNGARARSCEACGERKPAASSLSWEEPNRAPRLSRSARMKKRHGEYDDDEDESKGGGSDSDKSDDESTTSSSRGKLKRPRETESQVDKAPPAKKKKGRKPKQTEEVAQLPELHNFDALIAAIVSVMSNATTYTPAPAEEEIIGADIRMEIEMVAPEIRAPAEVETTLMAETTTTDPSPPSEVVEAPLAAELPPSDAMEIDKPTSAIVVEEEQAITTEIPVYAEEAHMETITDASPHEQENSFAVKPAASEMSTMPASPMPPASSDPIAEIPETRSTAATTEEQYIEANAPVLAATNSADGITADMESLAEVNDLTVRMLSILRRLQKNETSIYFWAPVPLDVYTDYRYFLLLILFLVACIITFHKLCSDSVSEPMDLGTIADRLVSRSFYGSDHERFARDVNLVWSNCVVFNMEGSFIAKIAQEYVSISL